MRTPFPHAVALAALCLALAGCGQDSAPKTEPAKPVVPTGADTKPAKAGTTLTGTVQESLPAGGYTYVRLKTDEGEVWAGLPATTIENGQSISIDVDMQVANFESKSLNRTFEKFVFAKGLAGGGDKPATTPPAAPAGAPPSSPHQQAAAGTTWLERVGGGPPKDLSPVTVTQPVPKATGKNSHTVAEIFQKRSDLTGKTVKVRGVAVKVMHNIMGKNWIHLQDGTGSESGRDNDLVAVAPTDVTVERGEMVTIEGSLEVDKSFGAGPKYQVVVENATVTR